MKNKLPLSIIAASTLLHTQASAEVDLRNGSFIYSDKSTLLVMTYNSRSLHQGLLGAGWCSPLEDSLQFINSTTLQLRSCYAGKIETYKLRPTALRAPSSAVKVFESGENRIRFANTSYQLTKDKTIQTFNQKGKLLEVKDERGKLTKLLYDKNGFLKDVTSGRKDSLQLKVDPRTGRVVEAIDHQGARTRLTFSKGHLISIVGPRTAQYFNYDKVGNLVELTNLKKTTSITYDSFDRVTNVTTAKDCSETYQYSTSDLSKDLSARTEVIRNCRGINNKRLVDFFYTQSSSGEISLDKVSIQNQQLRSSRLPATQTMGSL